MSVTQDHVNTPATTHMEVIPAAVTLAILNMGQDVICGNAKLMVAVIHTMGSIHQILVRYDYIPCVVSGMLCELTVLSELEG